MLLLPLDVDPVVAVLTSFKVGLIFDTIPVASSPQSRVLDLSFLLDLSRDLDLDLLRSFDRDLFDRFFSRERDLERDRPVPSTESACFVSDHVTSAVIHHQNRHYPRAQNAEHSRRHLHA